MFLAVLTPFNVNAILLGMHGLSTHWTHSTQKIKKKGSSTISLGNDEQSSIRSIASGETFLNHAPSIDLIIHVQNLFL